MSSESESVTVELESAVGPRVLYQPDVLAEDIEAALPLGWAVDYDTPHVRTDSGRLAAPLYRVVDLIEPVQVVKLGQAELRHGFLYVCRPEDDLAALEGMGFHGTDISPCSAEYLCDYADDGYLVISPRCSAEDVAVVRGWSVRPVVSSEGDFFDDGTWRLCVLRSHGGHEYTVAGSL